MEKVLKINPEMRMHGILKHVFFFDEQKSEALSDLRCAVELNPSYRESAKSDKDFEKLWEDQDFKDIVAINKGNFHF